MVVGVFFGSAVLGSTTAGQEDMCGRKVNQRGRFWGKRKLHFSCANSSDSSVKLERMEIRTEEVYRDWQ